MTLPTKAGCDPLARFFSLIELLVVIAVISLLMSVLLPALKVAKATALDASCKGNLKQLGQGLSMYANDFEGWIPYSANYTLPLGARNYYELLAGLNLLPPFVANKRGVYACPSGTAPSDSRQIYGLRCNAQTPTAGFKISNDLVDNRSVNPLPGMLKTWRSSSFIMIGDSRHRSINIQWESMYDNNYGGVATALPHMRHVRKGNYAFADGHVLGIMGADIIFQYGALGAEVLYFSNFMDADGNIIGYY